uniref:Uncharacterized protein n=1 Tax=Pristionchus pacificus TaxID=54126 RepID=A0A2A6B7C7_PRIPA|eukprot:PDM61771.1 hypothetical protein PRIPAC_51213 [Pristionchus pacificus]
MGFSLVLMTTWSCQKFSSDLVPWNIVAFCIILTWRHCCTQTGVAHEALQACWQPPHDWG